MASKDTKEWPVHIASSNEQESSSGQPSHGREPVGCLILKCTQPLSEEQGARIQEFLQPIAESMGAKGVVVDASMDVSYIPPDLGALVAAIAAQTQAIARLAASNEALIQAMAEDGSMGDDMPVASYLNGKPAVR